jgi:predicted RNA-binding protein associated with RNAse of E/G family
MADITMCDGNNCTLKLSCYRFKAKPGFTQSYFIKAPYNKKKNFCSYYWDLGKITKEIKDEIENS